MKFSKNTKKLLLFSAVEILLVFFMANIEQGQPDEGIGGIAIVLLFVRIIVIGVMLWLFYQISRGDKED